MILTVTLNPLLERRLTFLHTAPGKVNRNPIEEVLAAGGKGINVGRQLNRYNLENIALTFSGGAPGKSYKKIVADENIKAAFVQTQAATRSGTVITDKTASTVTTFMGYDPAISESESAEFLSRLEKMIANCEIVVFSGSSPTVTTDNIFPEGIRMANRMDKISFLDTYGRHLPASIDAVPTVIHNNLDELREHYPLSDDNSVFDLMNDLYKKGIKQTYVTNGASDTLAHSFDFHYRICNPRVEEKDPTGSGDAFMAGLVYGWHNNLTFEETVILASSLGAANASVFPVCKVDPEMAEHYKKAVKVIPVGKKMKLLDVTPD